MRLNIKLSICTRYFILLATLPWMILSCSQQIGQYMRKRVQTERYFSPFSFNYYPATLLLKNGDTISGRFTKYNNQFNLMHEDPDSNYHCDVNIYKALPEDFYYKKYMAFALKAYIVNGQRYEPLCITNKKTDPFFNPDDSYYYFMMRLTADSLSIQLYKYLKPDNDRSLLAQLISPSDTTINNYDYFIQYFIHFPDENPQVVWQLDELLIYTEALKKRMIETFGDCPALAETVRNIKKVRNNDYIMRVMIQPDSTITTKGLEAVMDRINLFDKCFKQKYH